MGYRVMIVLTGEENIGEQLKALSEGKTVPYSDDVFDVWDHAVSLKNIAEVYFPAVGIEVI